MERLKKKKPHGLDIKWDVAEDIYIPDAERVFREYIKTGKYDIIWGHSAYTPALKKFYKEYPDMMWVVAGSGNEALGGNFYWVDIYNHEAAYLLGVIAGMMTKTDVIGVVAGFPSPDVNHTIHGFYQGAKSVNPRIKVKVTYIESWFDPPKAKESALAQIAAGADFIYAERFGPFEACKEKGVFGFGQYVDQNELSPSVVVSSMLARWDPVLDRIIEDWWNHKTKGIPYNGPTKRIAFYMHEGGSDIAPYHGLDSKIPQKVKNAVEKAKGDIKAERIVVGYNESPFVSQ